VGNRNSGSNPDRSLLLRWCAMLFKMVVPNGCVSVTYVLVCVQLHHVALSALLINRWRCRFCVDHRYQHLRHRRWLVWLSMIVVLARMIPSVRYLQVSDTCCMMRAMCDSMSYFSSDASDTGYGQVANPATMDSILLVMQAMQQATKHISDQNQEMMKRIETIESRVNVLTACDGEAPEIVNVRSRWKCHVCGKVLQDAASFKGHILRLYKPSSRPKCHMNPQDLRHQLMVARFGSEDAVFHQRVPIFSAAYYRFVRVAISAKYDDDQSFELVSAWMAAVLHTDMVIPELSGTSGSGSSPYGSS